MDKKILVTYQGAFSPIHNGHKEAVIYIYIFLRSIHPKKQITILFMPTTDKDGKTSVSFANKNNNKKNSF